MEESQYQTTTLHQFAGRSPERIPDETTILIFRRLLEKHELAAGILAVINGIWGTAVYHCARAPSSMPR
jgi:transposase, IS5 family